MPHTYVCCDYHCVFATKERAPILEANIRQRLYSYFAGLARQYRIVLFGVRGIEDHIHLLISIPATMSISEAMKLFKGSSSRWIHQTFPGLQDFAWQEGYGAFSVSRSLRGKIIDYIRKQDIHHRDVSSETEFIKLLKKHNFDYST